MSLIEAISRPGQVRPAPPVEIRTAPRRGWCPSVRRPMATGDGLLARVHPPAGRLSSEQVRGLAAAADACGNGLLEVTGRGNLQIRGIRETTRQGLMRRLAAVDLLEPPGEGPHGLTLTSPLAGLDPDEAFDAAALAAEIERAGRGVRNLPPKFLVTVDGGGRFPLREVAADLHLVPATGRGAVLLGLPEAGHNRGRAAVWSGPIALDDVPALVGTLCDRIAAGERRRLLDRLGTNGPPNHGKRATAPRAGVIVLGAGSAAVLAALPFGRCTAEQFARLADLAEELGTGEVRLSFTRGVLLHCRSAQASALLRAARDFGLIVDPDDPRLGVSACTGRPACASGLADVLADAGAIADAAETLIRHGGSVHVSGCAKGCALPMPADLTLVGQGGGRYGIVLNGIAGEATGEPLDADDIVVALRHVVGRGDLAAAFGARRS